MKQQYIFVINPVAGKGYGVDIAAIIKEFFKNKKIDYKIIFTEKNDNLKDLLKKYNNSSIYSVGGDGTLKNVVNAIINTNNILNVIPSGSGNDFYKTLSKMEKRIHNIDIGMVNDEKFINIASLGLDAQIADEAEKMKNRHVPKSMIYNLSIIKTLFDRKDINVNVENEQKILTILAVCNGIYYGGGYKIAPHADIKDGLFDVYKAEKMNTLKLINMFLKLSKGTHEMDDNVAYNLAKEIMVTSKQELICNVDGEIIKDREFHFKILPNVLKLDADDQLGIKKVITKKLNLS